MGRRGRGGGVWGVGGCRGRGGGWLGGGLWGLPNRCYQYRHSVVHGDFANILVVKEIGKEKGWKRNGKEGEIYAAESLQR